MESVMFDIDINTRKYIIGLMGHPDMKKMNSSAVVRAAVEELYYQKFPQERRFRTSGKCKT